MIVNGELDLPLSSRLEVGIQISMLHASEEELAWREHVAINAPQNSFDLVIC